MHAREMLITRFADALAAAGRIDRTTENYRYSVCGFGRFIDPRALTEASADDIVAPPASSPTSPATPVASPTRSGGSCTATASA